MSDEITRALTAVIEPAPGSTLPLRRIHRAVVTELGHNEGVSFMALKTILRAVGVVVTSQGHGAQQHAHGVTLTTSTTN